MSAGFPRDVSGSSRCDVSTSIAETCARPPTATGDPAPHWDSRAASAGQAGGAVIRPSFYKDPRIGRSARDQRCGAKLGKVAQGEPCSAPPQRLACCSRFASANEEPPTVVGFPREGAADLRRGVRSQPAYV
jgi:hypothetical protein